MYFEKTVPLGGVSVGLNSIPLDIKRSRKNRVVCDGTRPGITHSLNNTLGTLPHGYF